MYGPNNENWDLRCVSQLLKSSVAAFRSVGNEKITFLGLLLRYHSTFNRSPEKIHRRLYLPDACLSRNEQRGLECNLRGSRPAQCHPGAIHHSRRVFRVFILANTYNRSVYPPRLKPTAVYKDMPHILPSAVRRRIKSFLTFIRGDKVRTTLPRPSSILPYSYLDVTFRSGR